MLFVIFNNSAFTSISHDVFFLFADAKVHHFKPNEVSIADKELCADPSALGGFCGLWVIEFFIENGYLPA